MTAMPAPDERPGLRQRSRIRRRARYLRRLRELQLRDIGGFVVELHRFGRERPDLLNAKVEAAAETDRELRELEQVLGDDQPVAELREPGIGGACPACGTVHGSSDRYCSWCGREL
jgi:glutathione S-transferase